MRVYTGEIVRDPRDRYAVRYFPSGQSMTELSHAQSCDINYIVNRYQATGYFPPAKKPPVYADVTPVQGRTLQEMLQFVDKAKAQYQVIIDELEARKLAAQAAVKADDNPPGE